MTSLSPSYRTIKVFFHPFLFLPQTAVYRQTYSGLYAVIQCIEVRATYYNAHELNRRY